MTRHSFTRITLLFILLLAAALRLVGLNNLSPPGIEHDEVANWLIDRSILAGNHAIYFTRAYGHEAGFHYLQAGFVALLGDNVLSLRLPAAFTGLLLVAVSYTLTRRLFGRRVGLIATTILATLFWSTFYSRLGLRAITLPLLSGLSAYFWWRGWESRGAGEQGSRGENSPLLPRPLAPLFFMAAGLFAGLSFHTYMAARAVPIFYGLWTVYLAVFHWRELRARWRGVALFWLIYALVAAPLMAYLLSNPGAEFRIGEVDAPLRALLAGDVRPVLQNGWFILRGFFYKGDPLWRQNVAAQPVFGLNLALPLLFYGGLLKLLWRWRTPKYGFVLLWLAVSVTPSLVTADAPSTIRMINTLPFLAVPIAQLMPRIHEFSTKKQQFSTMFVYMWLGLGLGTQMLGTAVSLFNTWPNNEEVQFVWQAALADMGGYLDKFTTIEGTAVQGTAVASWSPDTMDVPTMELLMRRDDAPLSFFNPAEGTLLLPVAEGGVHRLLRPEILHLDDDWEEWLTAHGAVSQKEGTFVRYDIPSLSVQPRHPEQALFGEQISFLGYDVTMSDTQTTLVTYWRVEKQPQTPARLFVQALDAAGNVIAADYHWDTADPQKLWYSHWQPGDLILQRHLLPVGITAVQLRIGIYNPYTCDPGPCQNLRTETGAEFVEIGD